ncbi:DUF354 domain-containing protein [Patescibacteria group bacterium]|nr:DUF354 domain-containing protein [Patescibacteria group bacterium]MBU4367844.1 DUF354 domain-containing protein [Patescibacteria group bacterium]MBU4462032.1 DUF354 domain-containing protein [Patescibacteria group bacterium]MCG2700266.1 DUF354 domain-containing protein [Candidatus Parcubacteria bacterium]
MKIFIDIGHPAHVHYFKNFIWQMEKKGHRFLLTARNRGCIFDLLNTYKFDYIDRGKGSKNILGKILNMAKVDLLIYKAAKQFEPDLFLGFRSMYAAQVSRLMKKPCILFDDTEHSLEQRLLFMPFSEVICTPSCFKKNLGKKQVKFNGYMELAYLHPNYFKPNPSALKELGIKKGKKFFILRFVAWEASHDIGHKGLSIEIKRKLIKLLNKYGKVFISSEKPLLKEFEEYKLSVSPEKIHDILYYATMYIGEGATMASEAAILGTPSLYISPLAKHLGNFSELSQRYGLVLVYEDLNKSLAEITPLFRNPNLKQEWQKKRESLLQNKIDVTEWMIKFVENYKIREN